jgi:hypothetical protein
MHAQNSACTPFINALHAKGLIKANDVPDEGLKVLMFVKLPMLVAVVGAGPPWVPVSARNLRYINVAVLDTTLQFRNNNAMF